MMHIREMIDLFLGKTHMDSFAGQNISIAEGIKTNALAFFVVAALILFEVILFLIVGIVLSPQSLLSSFLLIGAAILGSLILIPVGFVLNLLISYVWGALHFFIAKFFSNKPDSLNNFNGALLSLFGSITLVRGVVALVPVLGWIVSVLVQFYGVVLMFRFVKARFNLTDAQGLIVVLVPLNIVLGVILVFTLVISFIVLGTKI
ncbi:MAG TPA: hypothetical protein VJG83_05245 [archaeon]|nr:hypothetical protein [archaeon]